jgi:hypothetical protein
VLLRAGEVDEIRARLPGGMTMRSTCGPSTRRTAAFCVPRSTTCSTEGSAREHLDEDVGPVGLRKKVEVADRLAPSPERPGRNDPVETPGVPIRGATTVVTVSSARSRSIRPEGREPRDALEDEPLRPCRQPAGRAPFPPPPPVGDRRSSRCRARPQRAAPSSDRGRGGAGAGRGWAGPLAEAARGSQAGRCVASSAILSPIAGADARKAWWPTGAIRGCEIDRTSRPMTSAARW